MFGGQSAQTARQPAQTARQQANYRRRQQAGIDALIAIATPVVQQEEPHEESRDGSAATLTTNRNNKGS
jgi:hypothetical protein